MLATALRRDRWCSVDYGCVSIEGGLRLSFCLRCGFCRHGLPPCLLLPCIARLHFAWMAYGLCGPIVPAPRSSAWRECQVLKRRDTKRNWRLITLVVPSHKAYGCGVVRAGTCVLRRRTCSDSGSAIMARRLSADGSSEGVRGGATRRLRSPSTPRARPRSVAQALHARRELVKVGAQERRQAWTMTECMQAGSHH